MAVLDVTIPTGYMIQQQKLDAYVRNQEVRNLQRAKFLNQKVVFFFEYVSFIRFDYFFVFVVDECSSVYTFPF